MSDETTITAKKFFFVLVELAIMFIFITKGSRVLAEILRDNFEFSSIYLKKLFLIDYLGVTWDIFKAKIQTTTSPLWRIWLFMKLLVVISMAVFASKYLFFQNYTNDNTISQFFVLLIKTIVVYLFVIAGILEAIIAFEPTFFWDLGLFPEKIFEENLREYKLSIGIVFVIAAYDIIKYYSTGKKNDTKNIS